MQQSTPPLDYGEYKIARAIQQDHLRMVKLRLLPALEYIEGQFAQLREAIEQGRKAQEDDLFRNLMAYIKGRPRADREWIWYLLPDRDIHGNVRFVLQHYCPRNGEKHDAPTCDPVA